MTGYIDGIFPCRKEKPFVFHEILSDIVHIDVNIIPPDNGRDYYVQWTSGMSVFLPVIPLGEDYPGVDALICKDGAKINFLWAIPMYKEEIEYKLEEGFDAMMDLFTEVGFPRTLDPKRQNYIGGN